MANKIEKELVALTKVKRKDGESNQDFFRKLFDKANVVTDDEWKALSEPTQKWVNAAGDAVEGTTTIPNFDGEVVEDEAPVEEAEAESTGGKGEEPGESEEAEAEEDPKPAKKAAKKGDTDVATAKTNGAKAAPKKASAKKAGAKDDVAKPGRKGTYPLTAKITLKVKENPHRAGTTLHKMFAKYKNGMTVQQALDAGVVWANLRYLSSLDTIKIG